MGLSRQSSHSSGQAEDNTGRRATQSDCGVTCQRTEVVEVALASGFDACQLDCVYANLMEWEKEEMSKRDVRTPREGHRVRRVNGIL